MPALHLLVVPQIGHGWISVLHVPPGQSAVVMQPKLAFEPPWHLLDSQFPERAQSPSLQQACRRLRPAARAPPGVVDAGAAGARVGRGDRAAPAAAGAVGAVVRSARAAHGHEIAAVQEDRRLERHVQVARRADDTVAGPEASPESELTTQVLVALPLCEVFGIGNGGPKRHPAAVHWSSAQFALLQLPAAQDPPGVQSAPVVHGPAQSAVAVHVPPRFEVAPCVQRFPPASVGDAAWSVSVRQLQLTFVSEDPMSGIFDGSGTATPAPPKYRPPHFSGKKFGLPSASI